MGLSAATRTGTGGAARGDALVMFGLTGDLGEHKLLPALAELAAARCLDIPVVGVGRTEITDAELRRMLVDAVRAAGGDVAAAHAIDLSYVSGSATDPATFDRIGARLGAARLPVVYMALPPGVFGDAIGALAACDLPDTVRVVIEKPFGHDAASAVDLHRRITRHVDAARLFAVDHFLAKAAVENLLAVRAANPMIDAALRGGPVHHVEITIAEHFGVDGRGAFYDGVGAVADVVQSHLLQLVAVLLMDVPESSAHAGGRTGAAELDRARWEVLDAIAPARPGEVVLGQYEGYRSLDEVDPRSTTETFAALRLRVGTERWNEVPVLVRTGKRLTTSFTEAVVVFAGGHAPNRLRFRIKPVTDVVVELGVLDGDGHTVEARAMRVCAPSDHGALGDYATMLAGALAGDHRHFATIDDIVAAWRVVDPIRRDRPEPEPYEPGSMGPAVADRLHPDGRWLDLDSGSGTGPDTG